MIDRDEEYLNKEFDFENAKKNPYINKLKDKVTICLDDRVIEFFKCEADNNGLSFQDVIKQYLIDCADNKIKIVHNK